MYAIIAADGCQMRVTEGQTLSIDYRDVSVGDEIKFDRVLVVGGEGGVKLGEPTLAGASVSAKVVAITRGDKLFIQRFRRRKNYRRRFGHRQWYTQVRIDKIVVGG